jgi:tetratricopeptide (TPR) repeat protein
VFSPDGTRLAIGGNGVARLYDAWTGLELFPLPGTFGLLTFGPDATRFAVGRATEVRVYDAQTGKEEATLEGSGSLLPVFSPDGTRVAVPGANKTVRVHDARTGQVMFTLAGRLTTTFPVFSPDGKRIAIGGGGMVWVDDAWTGQEVYALKGAEAKSNPVFSPDGTLLAVGGAGAVWLCDARTGREAFTFKGLGPSGRPAFSTDGQRLAVLERGGLRVWTAPDSAAGWQAERRQALADSAPAWRGTRAADGERAGEWFAAAFHWGRVARAEPGRGLPHLRSGLALAHLGQTEAAKVEFETALALTSDLGILDRAAAHAELGQRDSVRKLYVEAVAAPNASPLDLAAQGVARLERGDRTGYTAACETLVHRFGKTGKPAAANEVAWACSIGPDALPDLKPAVELARRAVQANPKDYDAQNTLGAILYRAGQHEEAVRELNQAIKLNRTGGTGWDFIFLALAQHRLGRPDEARTWLDKAVRGAAWEKTLNETQRLELHLLRREAEALLKGPAPAEQK